MRGPLIFGKSPMGALIFGANNFEKKPAKPIFLRIWGKNKTIFFFHFLGGTPIFGGLEKNIRPLPINNEPSLSTREHPFRV